MTDEERIDKVLNAMAQSHNNHIDIQKYLTKNVVDVDLRSYQRIIARLEEEGTANRIAGLSTICMITAKGKEIANSGGYIAFLERQKAAEKAETKHKADEVELTEVNLNLNRFYLKYRWLPFILSAIAIIISIIALICSIVDANSP